MLSAPFMTIQEVADLLKVSSATVRTWIKNEELRAVKLEREFRIAKIDLQYFVDARATIKPSAISPNRLNQSKV